jgi:hypothetical protein
MTTQSQWHRLKDEDTLAALNDVSSSDSELVVATAALAFGTNETNFCDGRAKVLVGTGNYLLSTMTYIPLNLSVP